MEVAVEEYGVGADGVDGGGVPLGECGVLLDGLLDDEAAWEEAMGVEPLGPFLLGVMLDQLHASTRAVADGFGDELGVATGEC